jgi:hypothetical protein
MVHFGTTEERLIVTKTPNESTTEAIRKKHLRIGHVNAQSMYNKYHNIQALLELEDYDIL